MTRSWHIHSWSKYHPMCQDVTNRAISLNVSFEHHLSNITHSGNLASFLYPGIFHLICLYLHSSILLASSWYSIITCLYHHPGILSLIWHIHDTSSSLGHPSSIWHISSIMAFSHIGASSHPHGKMKHILPSSSWGAILLSSI